MHDQIAGAIDIDTHDSDDDGIDYDQYEVNMDLGKDQRQKVRRIYDSKYKIPGAKKLQASNAVTKRSPRRSDA